MTGLKNDMDAKTIETMRADILDASNAAKVAAIDHLAKHLAKAAKEDPRDRERTRAGIALSNIANWVKTLTTTCEPNKTSAP